MPILSIINHLITTNKFRIQPNESAGCINLITEKLAFIPNILLKISILAAVILSSVTEIKSNNDIDLSRCLLNLTTSESSVTPLRKVSETPPAPLSCEQIVLHILKW